MCDFLLKKVYLITHTHTQRITRNKKKEKKFVAQPVTTDDGETRKQDEKKTNEIMTTNPTNR